MQMTMSEMDNVGKCAVNERSKVLSSARDVFLCRKMNLKEVAF